MLRILYFTTDLPFPLEQAGRFLPLKSRNCVWPRGRTKIGRLLPYLESLLICEMGILQGNVDLSKHRAAHTWLVLTCLHALNARKLLINSLWKVVFSSLKWQFSDWIEWCVGEAKGLCSINFKDTVLLCLRRKVGAWEWPIWSPHMSRRLNG